GTPSSCRPGPSVSSRSCSNGGDLIRGSRSLSASEGSSDGCLLHGDVPEQAHVLLAAARPQRRRDAHSVPGVEPPVAAVLQQRRAEQVDPVVVRRRRLAAAGAPPAAVLPRRQGGADAAVAEAVRLVRAARPPERRRQPHVRLGLRLPPGVHGVARRRVVASVLGAVRLRHREEQAAAVVAERRRRHNRRRGDHRAGLRVGQVPRDHGQAVRAGARLGRARVGAPRPHLRAVGAGVRPGPRPEVVPRRAGAAGDGVALRLRVHHRRARRERRRLPGDAAGGGGVQARRGVVRDGDGVVGGDVPARGAGGHRRAVPGVDRPRRRAQRREGAGDEHRGGDLVP
ncbi:Os09g0557500, partial [Oryza sativa Japonica Group]